jgi:hypothetical protein
MTHEHAGSMSHLLNRSKNRGCIHRFPPKAKSVNGGATRPHGDHRDCSRLKFLRSAKAVHRKEAVSPKNARSTRTH